MEREILVWLAAAVFVGFAVPFSLLSLFDYDLCYPLILKSSSRWIFLLLYEALWARSFEEFGNHRLQFLHYSEVE